mmetsp:Transcript_3682/g.7718  ORF Transcript_3682/g.7718 Transcript_3682/m.7718 type:complete len:324 (-) Transcript_3682:972-1943(-)
MNISGGSKASGISTRSTFCWMLTMIAMFRIKGLTCFSIPATRRVSSSATVANQLAHAFQQQRQSTTRTVGSSLLLNRQRPSRYGLPSTTTTVRQLAQSSQSDSDFFDSLAAELDAEKSAEQQQQSAPDRKLTKEFFKGDKIQVEIISFGPLGASVDIVATSHNPDHVIPADEPALGPGLILQKEIRYFRQGRGGVDVVLGEVLPAFVEGSKEYEVESDDENVDDFAPPQMIKKYNICLREYGGKAKSESVATQIMERLEWSNGGVLPVGDKSPPHLISEEFPGVSKGNFKKAVAALYKQGKVQPGPHSVTLVKAENAENDEEE